MLFIFFAGLRRWLIYKRLRLLNFFPSGSGSWFFSSGSGSGSKEPKTPDSDRLRHPSPHLKVFNILSIELIMFVPEIWLTTNNSI